MNEKDKELYDNEIIDLYREHSPVMLGWLIRRKIPRPVAEEIVNDVFVAVRRRWPYIREGSPVSYAYKIAKNECATWWSKNKKEENNRHFGEIDEIADHDKINELITHIALAEAIKDLSPREQQVIRLRFFKRLSVRETAEAMGVSEGSVKGYTHTAINKLREKVDPDYNNSGEEEQ
ncbi:RNA polymerase sigma factor [Streptomyces graminilatus]|uniref:RNA polymerase sigma factor n=1 Tax=Streptomyces graminilatus TaxID=1464070 RepID=UPI00099EE343|nr:sigma-70 family RNA polymerase sigma factor [Streptomyces graminilatus]